MMTTELSMEPFLAQGPVSLQLSWGHEASPAVRCADSSAVSAGFFHVSGYEQALG